MQALPIAARKDEILTTILDNQVTIVVGETGSGKTTQLPQYLYEAGFADQGLLGITEPRRIAATSTAEFVASQLGSRLGDLVGYQVRFDDETSRGTGIKFMTDGILLREAQKDPDLRKYSVVMVDEAHERSVNIDFALGLLKDALKRRKDLRVVVASATIDEKKFSDYFWNAPIVNVSGRLYPVEVVWSDHDISEENMCRAVAERVHAIHAGGKPGDVLVFMPGEAEISAVIKHLDGQVFGAVVLPVFGALSHDEQRRIFGKYPGKRKIVVATNIAETSITVDGVAYVVDSGLVKQMNFHPETGIQSLDLAEHSRAGCEQRKGRAGRTQSGICYRMYSARNFDRRSEYTEPEIRRISLSGVVLAMEDIGIADIQNFDFVDPPDAAAFREAYGTLQALGALNRGKRGLTEIGRAMARLPLEPRISRMIIEAAKHNCAGDAAAVAAFLSVRNIFRRPEEEKWEADRAHAEFKDSASDALTFLKIWEEYHNAGQSREWCRSKYLDAKALYEVGRIFDQLTAILGEAGFEPGESGNGEAVKKAVAAGLAYNLLEAGRGRRYAGLVRPMENVFIHPGSALFHSWNNRWIVATEIVQTSKVFARVCSEVKAEWLPEIVPHLASFGPARLISYDAVKKAGEVISPVIYRGIEVGKAKRIVGAAEAARIQQEAAREAERNGWIPLVFRYESHSPGSFIKDCIADSRGIRYRAYPFEAGNIEPGAQYYCRPDAGGGRMGSGPVFVKPMFRVCDIKIPAEAEPETHPDSAPDLTSQVSALAERWGGKVAN